MELVVDGYAELSFYCLEQGEYISLQENTLGIPCAIMGLERCNEDFYFLMESTVQIFSLRGLDLFTDSVEILASNYNKSWKVTEV